MSKARLKHGRATNLLGLTSDLRREWRTARPGVAEPVIIEDETDTGYLRLYVIWSKWEGIDGEDRSSVIMDAFRDTADVTRVVKVTMAMGLTPKQAADMGIEYEAAS